LAAQENTLNRVNDEVRSAQQASVPRVSSAASTSASAQITAQEVKQEPVSSIPLNTTAALVAQIQSPTSDELLESNKKRKRAENTTEPGSKSMRTELVQSPSARTVSGVPNTIVNGQDNSINQDESIMENFFGETQPTPVTKSEMPIEEDQDIDLNDVSIDLMAESSQSQQTHMDDIQPTRKTISNQKGGATVAGLMNNMHKLLQAYSIIVPEHAELLQSSMNDPVSLAAIDLVRKFYSLIHK